MVSCTSNRRNRQCEFVSAKLTSVLLPSASMALIDIGTVEWEKMAPFFLRRFYACVGPGPPLDKVRQDTQREKKTTTNGVQKIWAFFFLPHVVCCRRRCSAMKNVRGSPVKAKAPLTIAIFGVQNERGKINSGLQCFLHL